MNGQGLRNLLRPILWNKSLLSEIEVTPERILGRSVKILMDNMKF
jgi:hypothetical protein